MSKSISKMNYHKFQMINVKREIISACIALILAYTITWNCDGNNLIEAFFLWLIFIFHVILQQLYFVNVNRNPYQWKSSFLKRLTFVFIVTIMMYFKLTISADLESSDILGRVFIANNRIFMYRWVSYAGIYLVTNGVLTFKSALHSERVLSEYSKD